MAGRPEWTRGVALGTQVFALLGAFVGTWATLPGFGPNSPLDVVYHFALIALLVGGIVVARRSAGEVATAA